jgi:hypothetical protein
MAYQALEVVTPGELKHAIDQSLAADSTGVLEATEPLVR